MKLLFLLSLPAVRGMTAVVRELSAFDPVRVVPATACHLDSKLHGVNRADGACYQLALGGREDFKLGLSAANSPDGCAGKS